MDTQQPSSTPFQPPPFPQPPHKLSSCRLVGIGSALASVSEIVFFARSERRGWVIKIRKGKEGGTLVLQHGGGPIGKGKEGPGETYTTTGHLQPPPPQHSPLHDVEPQHEQGPILALEGLKSFCFWFLIAKERNLTRLGGYEK